jgi:hypothetical protein
MNATLDSVMNEQTYEDSQTLLNPLSTHYVTLEGGNHSQFGDYGFQRGDTLATISLVEQHLLIAQELNAWMES